MELSSPLTFFPIIPIHLRLITIKEDIKIWSSYSQCSGQECISTSHLECRKWACHEKERGMLFISTVASAYSCISQESNWYQFRLSDYKTEKLLTSLIIFNSSDVFSLICHSVISQYYSSYQCFSFFPALMALTTPSHLSLRCQV